MNKEQIMNRLKEHYEYAIKNGYDVIYIALQGSQNYNLETENSDIDTKAIVVPSFNDFYNYKEISTTLILPNNEHCEVKDVRIMINNFLKQNTNYVEILFSNYYIINEKYKDYIKQILDMRNEIAYYDYNKALKCMSGMSKQKRAALTHPYPSLIEKINKYGYDPKQLHHIFRLNNLMYRFINNEPYNSCLKLDGLYKDFLIKIKNGEIAFYVEDAIKIADTIDYYTSIMMKDNIDENKLPNEKVKEKLHNITKNIIVFKLKENLLEENKKI